ncbi:MAG: DUF1836 domain-containing protein [Lachnospiraceae bacterium]|nr:DUF1836 domain-containing protein [Lachnospiraceae bacterium]
MTIDINDLIKSITESLKRIEYIKADDIPNIDLYMDQVTSFLDERLRSTTRNKGEDKILTKTMINNYAKNDLLPPPYKKKYSKDHMITLILIYYLKYFLSIGDIETILKPINENYFGHAGKSDLADIYDELIDKEAQMLEGIIDDIISKYKEAQTMYDNVGEKEADNLRLFAFITLLSQDVYIKKLLIEKLVDGFEKRSSGDNDKS